MNQIRNAAVAGMFYPGSENQLRKEITFMLEDAADYGEYKGIAGIVVPHAGYVYSGRTAAAAFKLLKKKYNRFIVISPSHREYFPGINIYPGAAYSTPFGEIAIDEELREQLLSGSDLIKLNSAGHNQEHAVEVILPFIQHLFPEAEFVPVVIGDQSVEYIYGLADALAPLLGEDVMVVVSSDLSHFYNAETAAYLDGIVENHINLFNYSGLFEDLTNRKCEACGGGGIVSLMKAAESRGINKARVIERIDSGRASGDRSEVVGYLSAVIYESE